MAEKKVVVSKDGPYIVTGGVPLGTEIEVVGKEGVPEFWEKGKGFPKQETYRLCRCGKSKEKPFCDDSHFREGFDGTETASRERFEKQAERIKGPEIDLLDVPGLCSLARFCHLKGGTWENTRKSDDPEAKRIAIETACKCPSGRLVIVNKAGKLIEPKLDKSISLIQDPQRGVSGPLWLKGGINIESSDGRKRETRNRMTLCRCGKSGNKPFCDGSHLRSGFDDGDESLK